MAKVKETPEPAEESGGGGKGEKKVNAEESKKVEEGQAVAEVSKEARTFAMLAHLLAIFTCFVGPLVIWLIKKDEHPFVEEQGKEALNFQITVAITYVVATLLPIAGCFLVPAVWVANLIFCIMACVAANKGEHYRYPVSIRFIK